MYSFRSSGFAALIGFFLVGSTCQAALIAYWDFNDSNLNVDQGTGILTTSFPPGDVGYLAGTTKNARPGVVAGQALRLEDQVNNLSGRLDFSIDTTGYEDLILTLVSQKTSTGFNSNQLSYSSNGGVDFTNTGMSFNPPGAFDVSTFDLTGFSALDDNPHAVLRITFGGATTASGNNRIDNVQFNANTMGDTMVPEPSTGVLASVGCFIALAASFWRRRKKVRGKQFDAAIQNGVDHLTTDN